MFVLNLPSSKALFYIAITFFFYINSVSAQFVGLESGAEKRELYEEAKVLFSKFENEHGRFIETPNVKMHYLSWGNPKDIPLVWCHGSLTNAYEFRGIADSLVKAGYYVIAIDYYGHGRTPIPSHPVSLYHIADDIRHLMDELRIKKTVIGGWSRGGAVATAFYDAYPERVSGIILEDGGSVSINTDYHRMEQKLLETTIHKITSSFSPDAVYDTEFEAYCAIYAPETAGSQFENLAWVMKTEEGKYAICPEF